MRTIDITTTQKVTIEYELASLRDRIIAYLMDQLILIACLLVLWLLFMGFFGFENELLFRYIITVPIYVFYTPVCEILMDGQTFGKRIVGIKVVKLTGQEPSNTDYMIRWVFRMIDLYLSVGTIAAMLVSSSSKSQRLGGITSNTTLIKVKFASRFRLEDIERISSLETYEPTYPEVKKLNEADMLLIKSIVSRAKRYNNPAHRQLLQELVDKLITQLELNVRPRNHIDFLKTLIRDYIVLTR
ncbi:MAG: RDD family protein [Saprospiraceae bacterium]